MWYDNWHPHIPLLWRYCADVVKQFNSNSQETLDRIIAKSMWVWPKGRKRKVEVEDLKQAVDCDPDPGRKDYFKWILN